MADSKISALPASTTPLGGTEVLPIVQGGTTKQVSVANLTAGRAVSAASVTTTGAVQASGNIVSASTGAIQKDVNSSFLRIIGGTVGNVDPTITLYGSTNANSNLATYDASSHRLRDVSGTTFLNVGTDTTNYGNFVIGTSGKGIDFTATPGTGTSELLADYEEGTWTPTQGGGLTVVGTYTSIGYYTKIGREVTLYGSVTGSTSIAVASASVMVLGIPYTPFISTSGSMNSNDGTKTGTVYMGSTGINSASAIAATSAITFTVTYFV